ncbi:MAG: pentapeptide repeat-containing protein [Saprospiraceae bacterium]
MKKALNFFTAHAARFFLLTVLLCGGLLCLIGIQRGKFDMDGLLTEANGMVFDLLVFAVLLSIYEKLREKRDKIERLHEEIDDYQGWEQPEATYRIVGAVRRLNKLEVTEIDLSSCFLEGANLRGAKLQNANLEKAKLQGAELSDAKLQDAKLARAYFLETKPQGASLLGADFDSAYILDATLTGADLREATFTNTDFSDSTLQGAIVSKNWFDKLEEEKVIGREEIKQKYIIDENGILRGKQ